MLAFISVSAAVKEYLCKTYILFHLLFDLGRIISTSQHQDFQPFGIISLIQCNLKMITCRYQRLHRLMLTLLLKINSLLKELNAQM